MAIIALDKITVKQLTTTQIITSVYSAVKELIENSLDGGANNIEIYLEDKGLSYIEIKDNGRGISQADSAFMALPSYTSKISNISDLESLETYGFRGEALNALCRVSEVIIITRTHEDDGARCYTLANNGSIQKAEFCNRAIGTTVQARSLFKNFPVRRQIINNSKTAVQDLKLIENLLHEFAICHLGLRICYRVDNVTIFSKIPGETMRENLINVFGRKFANQHEFLNFKESDHDIGLTIPQKNLDNLSDISQIHYSHIFVNNRPVVLKEFEKAIVALFSMYFGDKIMGRKRPIFFLSITVPPSAVDVNIEPNKTSVLLVNQLSIIETVRKMVIDYYEMKMEPEVSSISSISSISSVSSDPQSPEVSQSDTNQQPSSKRRKLEKDEKKRISEKRMVRADDQEKENIPENPEFGGIGMETPREEEEFSQLPQVNLGEDFGTQFVDSLPTLSTEQIEKVKSNLEQLNSPRITASQWSKGQLPFNFTGGTDVGIIGVNDDPERIIQKSSSRNSEANERGFAKFSMEVRPKLIKSNTTLNLVRIEKLLSDEWKNLTPEERQHYRDLGMRDKSLLTPKTSTPIAAKTPKSSSKDIANKKRLLNLLENMKDLETNRPKEKKGLRTVVPWTITMQTLIHSFHNGRKNKTINKIIGPLNDKLWITRTNRQLWCLNVDQLFEGWDEKRDSQLEKDPEFISYHLQRWLEEKDSMDLMSLIYEFE